MTTNNDYIDAYHNGLTQTAFIEKLKSTWEVDMATHDNAPPPDGWACQPPVCANCDGGYHARDCDREPEANICRGEN